MMLGKGKRLMYQDAITTEYLRKKFKNNFNLCNFAINIGKTMIQGGSQLCLGEILENVKNRAGEEESKKA